MESKPQSTPERQRPTWTQCTVIILVTLAAGVVVYLWRPLLLAPPFLELSWAVYVVIVMLWLPVLAVCILRRPTGSTRSTLWQVLAGFVLAAVICNLVPSTPFPSGSAFALQLTCRRETLDGNQVRYTCVADRMLLTTTYVLEGADGSPFVRLISVKNTGS